MIVNSCGPVSVCKVFDTFPPILPPSVMPSWMRTIYCAEMCRCKVTETTMDSYEKHATTIKKKTNSLMESNELDQVHADFFLTLKRGGGGCIIIWIKMSPQFQGRQNLNVDFVVS